MVEFSKFSQKNAKNQFIMKYLFSFYTYILDNQSSNFYIQIISIILQLFQIISFSFQTNLISYWKNDYICSYLLSISNYFRFIPFFHGQILQYSLFFIFITVIIIGYIAISIYPDKKSS